jgi:iron transport multicopper oxidase
LIKTAPTMAPVRLSLAVSAVAGALLGRSLAATVTYDFNVGWVMANPDGAYNRPTIGINGQWPIPPIVASVGDNVVVHVTNQLGNATTSLHFHGLYQNGTTHMDGPEQVSQCPIQPGSSFTYNFTVSPSPHCPSERSHGS